MRDGANIRYYDNKQELPRKSKLLLVFDDDSCINVTTSMYSAISVFKKDEGTNDKHYNLELTGVGVMDKAFTFEYFKSLINKDTTSISLKAFLATEQRILGIGNGSVQDILFNAKMNPKRKVNALSEKELRILCNATFSTIKEMCDNNGRDTEKNIYGNSVGSKTKMSKNTYKNPCLAGGKEIKKESYLGSSIYYCPNYQK